MYLVTISGTTYLLHNYVLFRWWLHNLVFPGWNLNPSSRGRFHPSISLGNQFHPGKAGQVSTWYFLQNPWIPIDSKMSTKWWNAIRAFLYFFPTDWRHMGRKNTTEITKIYWNVLLWIFSNWLLGGDYIIPVSRDEILSSFSGIPTVLYILHKLYLAILYCWDPILLETKFSYVIASARLSGMEKLIYT